MPLWEKKLARFVQWRAASFAARAFIELEVTVIRLETKFGIPVRVHVVWRSIFHLVQFFINQRMNIIINVGASPWKEL